ncbi:SGM_5486 family transporter-associated protein [Actinacidiphila alni]
MPVLEPNPPQSQRRLLIVFGLMLGVPALVAIVATIAARMG